MIKPLFLDGIVYDKNAINDTRLATIEIRNRLLKENDFIHSVALTHAIALLDHLSKHTDDAHDQISFAD